MSRPVHFLLIEDDVSHAQLVMLEFDDTQCANTVDRVSDGVEALAYLRRQGAYADRPVPDVVVVDLKMPRKDGHEVIRQIREDAELRSIPIVVLTSSSNETDKKRAYELQINSYLVKPIKFADFSKMIQEMISYWSNWNQRRENDPQQGPVSE